MPRASEPLTIIWDDRFRDYDFGPDHPFRELPRYLAVRLLMASGRLPSGQDQSVRWVDQVRPASRGELLDFHRDEYLALVELASDRADSIPLDQGDTPSFRGCYDAAARIVAGLIAGLDSVAETGGRAFHPAGGLHHAHPDRASGFCIFNDIAVGIAHTLARSGPVRRIAYVDIDAHHGDGVMYGYYGDGRVLDIDFHQDGRTLFPGTGSIPESGRGDGAGLKVNIPLPPGSGDETFGPLFRRVVPSLIRDFRPDLILLQHGVDGHRGDPLTQLDYGPSSYRLALSTLLELSRELCAGRLVVTGGGGYQPSVVSCRLAEAGLRLASDAAAPADEEATPLSWQAEYVQFTGLTAPRHWGEPARTPGPPSSGVTEGILEELRRCLGRDFPDDGGSAREVRLSERGGNTFDR
ncbi:MAG: acetoin utilization protein AcuC [Thermoplasmata archaeon]